MLKCEKELGQEPGSGVSGQGPPTVPHCPPTTEQDARAQATGKIVLSGPGETGAFRMVQNWGLRMKRILPRSGGGRTNR